MCVCVIYIIMLLYFNELLFSEDVDIFIKNGSHVIKNMPGSVINIYADHMKIVILKDGVEITAANRTTTTSRTGPVNQNSAAPTLEAGSANGSVLGNITLNTSYTWKDLLEARPPPMLYTIRLVSCVLLVCLLVLYLGLYCSCSNRENEGGDSGEDYTEEEDTLRPSTVGNDGSERRRLLYATPPPKNSRKTSMKQSVIDKYKQKSRQRDEIKMMWNQS